MTAFNIKETRWQRWRQELIELEDLFAYACQDGRLKPDERYPAGEILGVLLQYASEKDHERRQRLGKEERLQ